MFKMIKVFSSALLVLLLTFQTDLLNVPITSDIQSIISLANDMSNVITENASFYSLFSSSNSSSSNALTEALDQIDGLINQIDILDDQSYKTINTLLRILFEQIPIKGKLGMDIVNLRRYVRRIENLYSAMTGILYENYEDINQNELSHSFIETIVFEKNNDTPNIFVKLNGDVSENLDDMLQLVVSGKEPVNHGSFMEIIANQKNINDDNDTCNVDIPLQHHLLYTFYNAIVIIEAKAYLMSLFSLKFLQYSQQQDPEENVEKFQAGFIMRIEQYLLELKKDISRAREIYRCRINNFIQDETYTELRGLFTSYLMSIEQHDLMLMRTEQNCGNCFCQCVENSNASTVIKTFSLLPQYTETGLNMAVSNIRFVLKKNIIHLQIEQSPLLPGGYLNRSLSSWVPLPDFQYKPDGTVVEIRDEQELNLLRSVDYTFIDMKQNVINLDEISAESDHVIIAVRLNHEKPSEQDEVNTSPIQLEIFAIPYNKETGKLIENNGVTREWITPLTQPNPSREYAAERKELKYGGKVHEFEKKWHLPILKPNMFVKFGQSDQTTNVKKYIVPFIDLRSVDDRNNLSINGIGLFYFDGEDHAGYISLKLITMDLSNHLNPIMTSQQVESYSKFYQKPLTHAIPKI